MSEHSAEAERVDESTFGAGGETSAEADVEAAGGDVEDTGAPTYDSESADESVDDSYASDVAAAFDDPKKAPVQDASGEDGSF